MRHYSAELQDLNDVVAGANLEIVDAHLRVAAGVTNADAVTGFIISGGDHNFILDGQGSQFDPKVDSLNVLNFVKASALNVTSSTGTGAAATAPVINLDLFHNSGASTTTAPSGIDDTVQSGVRLDISTIAPVKGGRLEGTTLELFSVDGTDGAGAFEGEFSVNNRLVDIDLSSLAGSGGAGAATNPTNHILPVKTAHGVLNTFIDSVIQEVGSVVAGEAYLNILNFTTSYDGTGTNLVLTGVDASGFAAGDTVRASHPGTATVASVDVEGTVASVQGTSGITITLGGASAALAAANTAVASMVSVTRDQIVTGVDITGTLETSSHVIIGGDLTVMGDNTILNTATTATEEKYFAVNAPDTDGDGDIDGADTTTADGGFLVKKATETTVQSGGAVTAGAGGLFAGIRYNEATDGSGIWEVSQGVAADGSADAAWVPVSIHTGTVSKGVVTVAASGDNTITSTFDGGVLSTDTAPTSGSAGTNTGITVTDAGGSAFTVSIPVASNSARPFGNSDLTINIYEDNSMIIPDAVSVINEVVLLTLPEAYAGGALKIVIVG